MSSVIALFERDPTLMKSRARYFAGQALVAFASLSIFAGNYWSASERLIVNGVPQTVQVLNDSDDYLVVLDPGNGIVKRLPKTTVTERQYCRPSQGAKPFLARLFFGESNSLPRCPRTSFRAVWQADLAGQLQLAGSLVGGGGCGRRAWAALS